MASKLVYDGYTKVSWVSTISAIAAPTVSELDAGTDLTCFLTKDGLDTGVSTSAVDAGTLCSQFNGKEPGASDVNPTLKLYRLSALTDDDAWDLVVWGTEGFLVVRRMVAYATAWTAAQKVEVYKGKFGDPQMAPTAGNQNQMFTAQLFVSDFRMRATVAS